jgi:hypothetical protein
MSFLNGDALLGKCHQGLGLGAGDRVH